MPLRPPSPFPKVVPPGPLGFGSLRKLSPEPSPAPSPSPSLSPAEPGQLVQIDPEPATAPQPAPSPASADDTRELTPAQVQAMIDLSIAYARSLHAPAQPQAPASPPPAPYIVHHLVQPWEPSPARPIDGPQHAYFPLILRVLQAKVPLYLWGGAGSGKTTLAFNAARALDYPVHAQSFSPDTSRAEVLGYVLPSSGELVETPLHRAVRDGGLYLADEADACGPGLIALNMATANAQVTFVNRPVERHSTFTAVCTANTNGNGQADGYQRQRVDAALLDRMACLRLPHDRRLERCIAGADPMGVPATACEPEAGGVPTLGQWADTVDEFRAHLVGLGIRAPIRGSNRALLLGSRLAQAGIGRHWLMHMLLAKGSVSEESWSKIHERASARFPAYPVICPKEG